MDYVFANYPMLTAVTARHLEICLWSIGLALCVGIPLGMLSAKLPRLAPLVLGLVSIIYTVPSLAMFGLMIPVLGIGFVPAVVAIGLYSLLPVVQNTFTGIVTVRHGVREAAVGMGMGRSKILFAIEIPLAAPVIFAGIRTAVVSAVGMATLASLIGAGGLGDVIFRGISSVSLSVVLAGSIPVIVLALIADFVLKRAETRISLALGEDRA